MPNYTSRAGRSGIASSVVCARWQFKSVCIDRALKQLAGGTNEVKAEKRPGISETTSTCGAGAPRNINSFKIQEDAAYSRYVSISPRGYRSLKMSIRSNLTSMSTRLRGF